MFQGSLTASFFCACLQQAVSHPRDVSSWQVSEERLRGLFTGWWSLFEMRSSETHPDVYTRSHCIPRRGLKII